MLVVGLILSAIYATLVTLEDSFLLHPAPCLDYFAFDKSCTEFIPLPSGGLVLHCKQRANNTPRTLDKRPTVGRSIMCLHGNGGNIDGMGNLARMLLDHGYDVYVLEYAGYGMMNSDSVTSRETKTNGWPQPNRLNNQDGLVLPTSRSLVRDLIEGWNVLPLSKRRDAILFGCSMGGGAINQFLQSSHVTDADLPAQVVLVNTFFDLPQLVSQIFPIPLVSSLMRTRWNASPGLERYCAATKDRPDGAGNVLIVATLDDELIPLDHSNQMFQSIKDSWTKRETIFLPNGGHNNSVEQHAGLWLAGLVPAL